MIMQVPTLHVVLLCSFSSCSYLCHYTAGQASSGVSFSSCDVARAALVLPLLLLHCGTRECWRTLPLKAGGLHIIPFQLCAIVFNTCTVQLFCILINLLNAAILKLSFDVGIEGGDERGRSSANEPCSRDNGAANGASGRKAVADAEPYTHTARDRCRGMTSLPARTATLDLRFQVEGR